MQIIDFFVDDLRLANKTEKERISVNLGVRLPPRAFKIPSVKACFFTDNYVNTMGVMAP